MDVVDDAARHGSGRGQPSRAVGEGGRASGRCETSNKLARIKARGWRAVPTRPGIACGKTPAAAGHLRRQGQAAAGAHAPVRELPGRPREDPLLVEAIDSFDYLVVDNEHEAPVLEKNLINQYSPFFNADFKRTTRATFIARSPKAMCSRPSSTLAKHKSDTKYFGPFTDARAAREMMTRPARRGACAPPPAPTGGDSRARWRRTRSLSWKRDARPCFRLPRGPRRPGACCGAITPEEPRRAAHRALPRRQPPRGSSTS